MSPSTSRRRRCRWSISRRRASACSSFGWVRDARVSRRLPDTLVVDIVERRPAAIWQHNQRLTLIDMDGVVLEPVRLDAMPDLPLRDRPGRQSPRRRACRGCSRRRPSSSRSWPARPGSAAAAGTFASSRARCSLCPKGEAAARKALAQFAEHGSGDPAARPGLSSGSTCAIPGGCMSGCPASPAAPSPRSAPERAAAAAPGAPATSTPRPRRSDEAPAPSRPTRKLVTALDVGSSKVSALIAEPGEDGRLKILGTGQRESQGVRRGFIADMEKTEGAIREAVEQAERIAGHQYRGRLRRLLGRRAGQHRRQRRGRDRRPADREGRYRPAARGRPGFDRAATAG